MNLNPLTTNVPHHIETSQDRQDLIYNLMTKIDDFKHMITKMLVTFIEFSDAFGSVSHKFILETLEKLNIPKVYRDLIEGLYK